jgi:hypothetical protein
VGTIEQREALRYLDAILEVLRAIGATPQEEIVLKLYVEQQSDMAPLAHVAAQPNAAQKSGATPTPHLSVQPPPPHQRSMPLLLPLRHKLIEFVSSPVSIILLPPNATVLLKSSYERAMFIGI